MTDKNVASEFIVDMSCYEELEDGNKTDYNKTLPWVEKFRPKKLDDIIGNDNIKNALKHYLEIKKLPHLIKVNGFNFIPIHKFVPQVSPLGKFLA